MFLRRLLLLAFLFLLVSCGGTQQPTITYGPTTQTGSLTSTGVSLIRRGTHVLSISGKPAFYLESKTENLQEYDGQEVVIQGRIEPNIEAKYLPVIVVQSIKPVSGSLQFHEWQIPALNISLEVPDDWKADITSGIATFTRPSDPSSILTISANNSGSSLPGGLPLHLKGRTGITVIHTADAGEDLYLRDKRHVLHIQFTPPATLVDEKDIAPLRQQFSQIISSLKFLSDASASSSFSPLTNSGSGMPCGGTAGILCESGYYCEITDKTLNIGRCKKS